MKKQVIVIILFITSQILTAQQVFPVAMNGFLIPPHSLDLSVYTFDRTQDMIFNATLNDPIELFRDVRLQLTIKVDNQDIYVTDPNYGFTPIRLNQFEQVTFDGSALAPYLTPQALMGASGFGMGSLEIPEGFNKVCVEVIDIEKNKPISTQACAFGSFTLNQPPQLLLPSCGDMMELPETQNLLFNWTPMHVGSGNSPVPVEYVFELVELLPGIMDPNDGFENALQIYQTTVMTPSLLYTQAEPQLEANKSYGWRVKAQSMMHPTSKLFQNEGYSQVCTFTYTEAEGQTAGSDSEEDSQVIPQGCEVFSTDFGPVNGTGVDPIPLVEGDIVKLGYFEMEVLDAVPSGDGYSGSGFVSVPMLGAKVQVNFQDLKVKGSLRAYSAGSVEAIVDTEYALDPDLLVPGNVQNVITEDYVENLESFFQSGQGQNRLTSQFNPSDPVNTQLPLGIDKDVNGEAQPLIAVTGIRFTERNAFMDCVSFQRVEGDALLRFFKGSLPITPLGVKSNSILSLLDEVTAPLSGIFQINIASGGNSSGMGMDCSGYTQMSLEEQIQIDEQYIVQTGNSTPIVFELSEAGQGADGYIGGVESFNDFEIPSLPGFVFEMNTGQIDLNPNQSISFTNPNPYEAANENGWQGLFLDEVQVTLPPEYDFTGNEENFQLQTGSLFLSEAGAFGNFSGSNLVSIEEGRMGEWPFSIDLFELSIEEGSPNSTSITGKLQVPLLDDPFDYSATLDTDGGEVEIEATPTPGDYNMEMWNATFAVNENTVVQAELLDLGVDGKQFFPSAELNGQLSFTISEQDFEQYVVGDKAEKRTRIKQAFGITGAVDFELNDLPIEDFVIDPTAPSSDRYTLFGYGTGADSLSVGGKLIPITEFNVLYDPDGNEELGLEVEVTQGLNELTVIIWARANTEGGFSLQRIETSTKKVDCDCAYNEDVQFNPEKLGAVFDKHYQKYYAQGKPRYSEFSAGGSALEKGLSQEELDMLHKSIVFTHLHENNINGFIVDDINNVTKVEIPFLGVWIEVDENGKAKQSGKPLTMEGIDSHLQNGDAWELPYDLTEQIEEFLYDNNTDFPSDSRLLITDFQLPSNFNSNQIPNNFEVEITMITKLAGTDQYLKFVNSNVQIGPQQVGFKDLKLFLEIEDPEDPSKNYIDYTKDGFQLKYISNGSNEDLSTGSFVTMQCEGFQFFNIQAELITPYIRTGAGSENNSLKMIREDVVPYDSESGAPPTEENFYYREGIFPMVINGPSPDNFIAPLKDTDGDGAPVKFEVEGLEFKQLFIQEAFFDLSSDLKAEGDTKNDPSFKGLVFNSLDLQVDGMMTKEGEQRVPLKMPVSQFSWDTNGFDGNIELTSNVINKEKNADIGGWRYQMDSFKYGVFDDQVECSFAGSVLLPIFKDTDDNGSWIPFYGDLTGYDMANLLPTGSFSLGSEENPDSIASQSYRVAWIPGLEMRLEEEASTMTFTYNGDIQEYDASVTLNGTAGLFITEGQVYEEIAPDFEAPFTFGMDLFVFQGFSINATNSPCGAGDAIGGIRDIDFGVWGLAGAAEEEEEEGEEEGGEEDGDDGGGDDEDAGSSDDEEGSEDGEEGEEEGEEEEGLNGFPFSVEALQFNCTAPGTWNLILGLKINLCEGDTVEEEDEEGNTSETETAGLSATTQLNFEFQKNASGKLAPSNFYIDAIFLNGEFDGLTVDGFLVFMREGTGTDGSEPGLYGDGFKGMLDLTMDGEGGGMQFTVLAQFGTTAANAINEGVPYRYFFMEVAFVTEAGIILNPTPITINGANGAIFFNCSVAAKSGVDDVPSYSDMENSDMTGIVEASGPASSTSLAIECPWGDLCDPGVGMGLYDYTPSQGSFGVQIGVILTLNNKPETMVANVTVGAEMDLVDGFSFNRLDISGAVYFQAEDLFDPTDAPVQGSIDLAFDFKNKEIRGQFGVSLEYEEGGVSISSPAIGEEGSIAGNMFFSLPGHADAGKWYFKLAEPLSPATITLGLEGVIEEIPVYFYLQMGHDLDGMPAIKDLIPDWPLGGTTDNRLSESLFSGGDGFVFGLRFEFSKTAEMGPFFGSFSLAQGFDLSMMKYAAPEPPCEVTSFGINNWYIRGQAYAYITASMGMNYDLGFKSGTVNIFEGAAAIEMVAELPNPTYFRARVYASYDVLGGLIKGSVNFKLEVGDKISGDCLKADFATVPAELSIPLISDKYPDTDDEQPEVFFKPQVSFGLPIGETIVFPIYNTETFELIGQEFYRPMLHKFIVREVGSTEELEAELTQTSNTATLTFSDLLKANTDYEMIVEARWDFKQTEEGQFNILVIDGQEYIENHTIPFTTGDFPTAIQDAAIARSQPADGQHFWTKDYANPSIELGQQGWDVLFPASAQVNGETVYYDYTVQLTEYEKSGSSTGKVYNVPVSEYPGMVAYETEEIKYNNYTIQSAGVTLKIPYVEIASSNGQIVEFEEMKNLELEKGYLYKLEILRVPIQETLDVVATETVVQQVEDENSSVGLSIPLATLEPPADYGSIMTIYKMWFGTSMHDSFSGKVNTYFANNAPVKSLKRTTSLYHPLQNTTVDGFTIDAENPIEINVDVAHTIRKPGSQDFIDDNKITPDDFKDIVLTFNANNEGFDEFDIKRLEVNFNQRFKLDPAGSETVKEPIEVSFLTEDRNQKIDALYQGVEGYKNVLVNQYVETLTVEEKARYFSRFTSDAVNGFGNVNWDKLFAVVWQNDYYQPTGTGTWKQALGLALDTSDPSANHFGVGGGHAVNNNPSQIAWHYLNGADAANNMRAAVFDYNFHNRGGVNDPQQQAELERIQVEMQDLYSNAVDAQIGEELQTLQEKVAIYGLLGQTPESLSNWKMLSVKGGASKFSITENSNGTVAPVESSNKAVEVFVHRPGIVAKQMVGYDNIMQSFGDVLNSFTDFYFEEIMWIPSFFPQSMIDKLADAQKAAMSETLANGYIDELPPNNTSTYLSSAYDFTLSFPNINSWAYLDEPIDPNAYTWDEFTYDLNINRHIVGPGGSDNNGIDTNSSPPDPTTTTNPLNPIKIQQYFNIPDGSTYTEAFNLVWDEHRANEYGLQDLWIEKDNQLLSYIDLENEEEDLYLNGQRYKVFYDAELNAPLFHYQYGEGMQGTHEIFFQDNSGIKKIGSPIYESNNISNIINPTSVPDKTIPQREQLLRFPRNLEVNPLQMLTYTLGSANSFDTEVISIYDEEGNRVLNWQDGQKTTYTYSNNIPTPTSQAFSIQNSKGTGQDHVLYEMEPEAAYKVYIKTDKGDESFLTDGDYWVNRGGASVYRWNESFPDAVFLPLDANTALNFEQGMEVDLTGNSGTAAAPLDMGMPFQNMTLEAWVKFDNNTSIDIENVEPANVEPKIIHFEGGNTPWSLRQNGNNIKFEVITNVGSETISATGVSIGEWTHIAAVYDGSEIRLVINGVLEANKAHSGFINYQGDGFFKLGGNNFDGRIDEVALWREARDLAQIIGDANEGILNNPLNPPTVLNSLAAYYPFNNKWKETEISNEGGGGLMGSIPSEINAATVNLWVESEAPKELGVPAPPPNTNTGLPPVIIPPAIGNNEDITTNYAIEQGATASKILFKNTDAFGELAEVSLYKEDGSLIRKWFGGKHSWSLNSEDDQGSFEGSDWLGDLLPTLENFDKAYVYTKSGNLYSNNTLGEGINELELTDLEGTPYAPNNSTEQGKIKVDRRTSSSGAVSGMVQLTYLNSRPIEGYDIAIYDDQMTKKFLYFSGEEVYREYVTNTSGATEINVKDWDGAYIFNLLVNKDHTIFLRNGNGEYKSISLNNQFWQEEQVVWFNPNSDFESAPQLATYFEIGDYALQMKEGENFVTLPSLTLGDNWTIQGWMKSDNWEEIYPFASNEDFNFRLNLSAGIDEEGYNELRDAELEKLNLALTANQKWLSSYGQLTQLGVPGLNWQMFNSYTNNDYNPILNLFNTIEFSNIIEKSEELDNLYENIDPALNEINSHILGFVSQYPALIPQIETFLIDKDNDESFLFNSESEVYPPDYPSDVLISLEGLEQNQWYHYALTYDNQSLKLYINGVEIWSDTVEEPMTLTNGLINLGSSDRKSTAIYDDISIWKYTKSQEDVQNDFVYGITPTTQLKAYYNFNDGPGSNTLSDVSGNDKHGSLEGFEIMTDWIPSDRTAADYLPISQEDITVITPGIYDPNQNTDPASDDSDSDGDSHFEPSVYTMVWDDSNYPIINYQENNDWFEISEIYLRTANTGGGEPPIVKHWMNSGYLYELNNGNDFFGCGDIPDGTPLIDSSESFEVFLKTTDGTIYHIPDTNASGFQLFMETDEGTTIPVELEDTLGTPGN